MLPWAEGKHFEEEELGIVQLEETGRDGTCLVLPVPPDNIDVSTHQDTAM
jgi:hypothetical protein